MPPELISIVEQLETHYGAPVAPLPQGPFEMILWENVAYLLDDAKRAHAFETLRSRVGLTPQAILKASDGVLLAIARIGGMRPEIRVERLREIARLTLEYCAGDLNSAMSWPAAKAKKLLKRYPSTGDPGADKILMFAGTLAVLALDSNGLRVLVRLGYGFDHKNYAASYRSVQDGLKERLPQDTAFLVKAHILLRRHGQELCRRAEPACAVCPLNDICPYAKSAHNRFPAAMPSRGSIR